MPKQALLYCASCPSQTVLPSKAIRNEKIMDTLMLQANLGTFREREIDRKYLDALENLKRRRPDPDAWAAGNDSKFAGITKPET